VNSGRAVGPGRRPILPPDLHRTASRARRERWWQEWRREPRRSRTKETSEGRKEEKKASEEGSNNNDRRKKKTKKKQKEKEHHDHADWIVGCFLFLPIDHFAFQRMIQTYYYASSFLNKFN